MNAATVAIRVLPSGFDASTAASIAAALGTLVLAYFTWRLADQTKRLAAETEEDVRAEWRPVLVARAGLNVSVNAGDTLAGATVLLRNVGRGPALNASVTILSESSTEHQEAGPLHLGQVLDDAQISTGAAPLLFRDSSGGSESRLRYTVTVTYEDLGSRHYTTVIEFDDPSGGQHPHPQAPADWPIDIARTSVRLA